MSIHSNSSYIGSDKPQQNGHVGSFNGSLQDEYQNEETFVSIADARRKLAPLL